MTNFKIDEPHCFRCGTTDNLIKGSKLNYKGKVRQYHICRTCNTKRVKEYRHTEYGRERTMEAVANYNRRNKEKVSAWVKARKVTLTGKCSVPGCLRGDTVRHHTDYADKKTTELCRFHHVQLHRGRLDTIKSAFIYPVKRDILSQRDAQSNLSTKPPA